MHGVFCDDALWMLRLWRNHLVLGLWSQVNQCQVVQVKTLEKDGYNALQVESLLTRRLSLCCAEAEHCCACCACHPGSEDLLT